MQKYKSTPALFLLGIFISIIFMGCRKETSQALETGNVSDIDGNIYKTVKIGNKWWMAENLKVKRYSNGDAVAYVAKSSADHDWSMLQNGAYSYQDEKFGFVYNFYAVADSRKLAPEGWHIPSDNEWKELEMYLGMSTLATDSLNWRGTDQGNKLKIDGGSTSYWSKSSDVFNIYGTNESGFTALGGACRIFNGKWGDITHTGFWWSSTMLGNMAWYRGLDYNKKNVFRYSGYLTYGFSIRCVKD